MSTPQKVYLVVTTEYDGYCVYGIFSTHEKAATHAKEINKIRSNHYQAYIEEWTVDEPPAEEEL